MDELTLHMSYCWKMGLKNGSVVQDDVSSVTLKVDRKMDKKAEGDPALKNSNYVFITNLFGPCLHMAYAPFL